MSIELERKFLSSSMEMRDIYAIKVELIKTLVNNLNERFTTDDNIFSKLEHFIKLKEEVDIKQVHTLISNQLI